MIERFVRYAAQAPAPAPSVGLKAARATRAGAAGDEGDKGQGWSTKIAARSRVGG